jgi:uncharacterized protein
VFPAAALAALERAYTGGRSVADYFDLIAGTSTGGVLALGLGARISVAKLLDLYVARGCEIFPPFPDNHLGRLKAWLRDQRQYARYIHDSETLRRLLTEQLGDRLFGESQSRLCIPAFEGRHSEVFVFKTPHNRDYKTDRFERMVNVALATAAAPTYFKPLDHGGYTLVDGGVWANNPIMLAVIEALICFDIGPGQIDILSLSCGVDRYVVSKAEIAKGGLWHWKNIMGPPCACNRWRRPTRRGFSSVRRRSCVSSLRLSRRLSGWTIGGAQSPSFFPPPSAPSLQAGMI